MPSLEEPFTDSPTLLASFNLWFLLGIQSFGGGVATLTLIRRAVVDQRKWLTEEEFVRDWALCQVTPGINLLAIAILIGRKTGGFVGAMVALAGLLLPSAVVTVLMTALYRQVQGSVLVQHALLGLIPGSIGLGCVTAYGMGKPPILQSQGEGDWALLFAITILVLSGCAVALLNWPVLAVLASAGVLYGVFNLLWRRRVNGAAE